MEILRETFFIQGLFAAVFIGIGAKCMVLHSYRRLLAASEEMDRPRRNWIGVLKKKFESYYQLDAKVHNVSCIVDKYFENHKVLGITISFWEQIPGFCGILCMILGFAGAIRGIFAGMESVLWIRGIIVSALCSLGIFLTDYLFPVNHMKRLIRINLIHFMENVLPNRADKGADKKKKEEEENLQEKQLVQDKKREAKEMEKRWEQTAAARELELTGEDIQTLKDFINDL